MIKDLRGALEQARIINRMHTKDNERLAQDVARVMKKLNKFKDALDDAIYNWEEEPGCDPCKNNSAIYDSLVTAREALAESEGEE